MTLNIKCWAYHRWEIFPFQPFCKKNVHFFTQKKARDGQHTTAGLVFPGRLLEVVHQGGSSSEVSRRIAEAGDQITL